MGEALPDTRPRRAAGDTERRVGRARELQDEIRRRSGDSERPRAERDYLGRLLERF